MRKLLFLALLAACRTSDLGACRTSSDCVTGAVCDPLAHVCVLPAACVPACAQGEACVSGQCVSTAGCALPCPSADVCVNNACVPACNPACASGEQCDVSTGTCVAIPCSPACAQGQACVAGTCVASGCSPACDAAHTCDLSTNTCVQSDCIPACDAAHTCDKSNFTCVQTDCSPACDSAHVCDKSNFTCVPVGTADVTVTSPASGAFVSGSIAATALAHAPGGVTSLTFELRSTGGALLASIAGTAASDGATFSGAIPLAGIPDGPAAIDAVAAWSGGSTQSAAVSVVVDQTAPTLSLTFDDKLYAGGQTATLSATASDGAGSGVASVTLVVNGHSFSGTASGSAYSFSIPIDDSIAPAGATTSVPFTVTATDKAGLTASDSTHALRVDRDAPAISAITVVPPPDANGVYGPGGGALQITASMADGAGIDPASVCLVVGGACTPGALASGTWTFALARPQSGFDGTQLTFAIAANDTFAAQLPPGFAVEHEAQSAPQSLLFDTEAPVIAIAPDATHYARTLPGGGTNFITVSAQVTDTTGVAGVTLGGVEPRTQSGSTYTFDLDPTALPAGTQGELSFSIAATDLLGNTTSQTGSRYVDDAPPAALVKVFSGSEPPDGGVTYPASAANSGHNGAAFIYSDVVHVKGSLSDPSGIDNADLHIDGIAQDGGIAPGARRALPCDAGVQSCDFDLVLALNDAQNGAFHTGTGDAGYADFAAPFGQMQIVVDARDQAQQNGGGEAGNSDTTQLSAGVTRLLWYMPVSSGVSGIALQANGDVLVTTDGGSPSVYDFAPDQPLQRWTFAAGPIIGAPSIGLGPNPPAYIAAESGDLYALASDGGTAGHIKPSTKFLGGPAVASSAGRIDEVLVADSTGANGSHLWSAEFDGGFYDTVSQPSVHPEQLDGPMVFDGGVFIGTTAGVDWHAVPGDGTIGASIRLAHTTSQGCCAFFGPVTDGRNAYLFQNGTTGGDPVFSGALAYQSSLAAPNAPVEAPTVGIDGLLYYPDSAGEIETVNASGTFATAIANLGGNGKSVLQGSDGHLYVPRATGLFFAYENGALSWLLDPSGTISRGALIDCQGRLFIGSGTTVFALISDDHGLAETGWPALRRDSRNSGNAATTQFGMRTAAGCTQ